VKHQTEIELKFLVPATARAGVGAEMSRGSTTLERISLAAMYLDTRDRRLAAAGLSWRLRREGRRWIQTLKAGAHHSLQRFEHEVIRADASHDASEHAGTPVGEKLIALLRRAHADGEELVVRFQTGVRRTVRRIRTRGAVVEIALDEGRLMASGSTQRIREIGFELISGDPAAMFTLVERWRKRFDLIYDPRSKAERGDRLAQGLPFPPLRKAVRPDYPDTATAAEALGVVVDECLAQIARNAIGLIEGETTQRVEHVHQLRVGIRRLRSAWRSFQGWAPSPPPALVSSLRTVFDVLGMSRDSDVLDSGVAAELVKAGAPPLQLPAGTSSPDPVEAVKAGATQKTFLACIAWRLGLGRTVAEEPDSSSSDSSADALGAGGIDSRASQGVSEEEPPPRRDLQDMGASLPADADAAGFHRKLERRLRRWHERIVADWKAFDAHDEDGLHALRKRIKRQRYAAEFFAPVLRPRQLKRYLDALAVIQDRMGELNDLFVARARYQAIVASDPAAWFAMGWLAARIAEARALAKPELGHLARVKPPAT
jgi:inorganic triphosphatase YgiF